MWRFFPRAHFDEHAGDFASINLDVVGQFDGCFERKFVLDRVGDGFRRPRGEPRGFVHVDLWPQQDRKAKALPGGRFPTIAPLTAAGGLMFGEDNQAFLWISLRHL